MNERTCFKNRATCDHCLFQFRVAAWVFRREGTGNKILVAIGIRILFQSTEVRIQVKNCKQEKKNYFKRRIICCPVNIYSQTGKIKAKGKEM